MMKSKCIACKGQAKKIGEVPYSFHFLDEALSSPLDTGDLFECSNCGLWFKHPFIAEGDLARYYKSSSSKLSWDGAEMRPDFASASSILSSTFPAGGTVLDFGCYNGQFLKSLPSQFYKYGVEPSTLAAEAASNNGIRMLGTGLCALKNQQFDAVTMFDVFEHLRDPIGTLDTLFGHVQSSGIFCIGTGFGGNQLFKRTRSKYSYVCMPEHVCFLTEKFLDFLSHRYSTKYIFSTIRRNSIDLKSVSRATAINVINFPTLMLTKKAIQRCYRSHRLRVIASRGILPIVGKDHILVVFFKDAVGVNGSSNYDL